jgi:hypothetical protein
MSRLTGPQKVGVRSGLGLGLGRVGWVPPDDEIEYPEWVKLGRYIGAVGRGCQWWIGDWIRYGTGKWGEKYAEAARITGYDPGRLRNIVWIASQFELSRRRDKLMFSHHEEVASLAPAEQDSWLDLAIEQGLSS